MKLYAATGTGVFVALIALLGATEALGAQLAVGQRMSPGSSISAGNRRAVLAMQEDGNLVLYHQVGIHRTPAWASGTRGPGAFAVLQTDGNLVVYQGGRALWSSATNRKGGTRLIVQDDGNLVLYTASGAPVWSTSTSLATTVATARPQAGTPPIRTVMKLGGVYHATRRASSRTAAPRRALRSPRPAPPASRPAPRAPRRPVRAMPGRTSSSSVWKGRRGGTGKGWCFRLIVKEGTPVEQVVWLGRARDRDASLRKIERISRLVWGSRRTLDSCNGPSGRKPRRCGSWEFHRQGNEYWFELPTQDRDSLGAVPRKDVYYALRHAKIVAEEAASARLQLQTEGPGRVIYSRGRSWCR